VNPLAPQPQLTLKSALGLKVRSIMLDPGHGGHDPGAVGFGVQEKEVALRIALRLRALLAERHPDLRVGMTRETDAFIPLQERPLKAKAFGADLFVSIHLNANEIERFHGVETYFLNLTRDSGALQVAARENATTEKHVSDLNEILVDLLRDTTIVESSELAKVLQTSLVGTLHGRHPRVRDLGVKQAPFLVLMGAEMPGVLVEVGFVTNRGENRRLQDDAYLNRIADGIYEGLRRYIERQNIVASREHTTPLARGDNL
jgi:N-acetylmuramoyl-L-alanine amidase